MKDANTSLLRPSVGGGGDEIGCQIGNTHYHENAVLRSYGHCTWRLSYHHTHLLHSLCMIHSLLLGRGAITILICSFCWWFMNYCLIELSWRLLLDQGASLAGRRCEGTGSMIDMMFLCLFCICANCEYCVLVKMELREEKVKLRTEKKRREEKVGCLSISSSFTACAGFYPTINPKAIPCPPDYPATMLTMDAICISLDASQDQFLRSPVARPFLLWSPCWLGLFSRSVMMLDVKTLLLLLACVHGNKII